MGNGKLPSGKLDAVALQAFGKRETGNWLLNLPRRDILQSTVEGFRSIKTEPFEGCENIVKMCFVSPCLGKRETGNGKWESVGWGLAGRSCELSGAMRGKQKLPPHGTAAFGVLRWSGWTDRRPGLIAQRQGELVIRRSPLLAAVR